MNYYPVLIAGSVLFLYFISYIFTRRSKVSEKLDYPFPTHRKIWNIVLFLFFLGFAPLGFLLAINRVYYIGLNPVHLLSWHINFGSAFFAIAIMHALWHLRYYQKGIRKLLKRD